MINTITIQGNIARDNEVKVTANGQKLLRNTLAVRRNEEVTDWVDFVAFNKTAELLESYTKKGNQLTISGRLQTSTYERQDGTKAKDWVVVVNDIGFASKQKEETPQYSITRDDLPF